MNSPPVEDLRIRRRRARLSWLGPLRVSLPPAASCPSRPQPFRKAAVLRWPRLQVDVDRRRHRGPSAYPKGTATRCPSPSPMLRDRSDPPLAFRTAAQTPDRPARATRPEPSRHVRGTPKIPHSQAETCQAPYIIPKKKAGSCHCSGSSSHVSSSSSSVRLTSPSVPSTNRIHTRYRPRASTATTPVS